MTRLRFWRSLQKGDRGPNCLALAIALVGTGILYLNFGVTTVGADPARAAGGPPVPLPPPPPPLPRQAAADGDISPGPQGVLRGEMALRFNILLLEKAADYLRRIPTYTATFYKQERIKGELTDGQTIQLKMRHKPFSVYMKWLTGNEGQQALYVQGKHDGKMLVQLGGWKARLPTLKLDPNGSLALSEARYPVTKAGILELVREGLAIRTNDLKLDEGVYCEVRDGVSFDGQDCYLVTVEYDTPAQHKTYRKCVTYMEKRSGLPLCTQNFTWAEGSEALDPQTLDAQTLVEYYTFTDINTQSPLASGAFDRDNEEYSFR